MTDFEKELLEQLRDLRIQIGQLSGQVHKNEGTLEALVQQVALVETKVDALPQIEKKSSGPVRDGALTLSGGAVAAIISVIVQHWSK
jgi:hypothetical protein